MCFFLLVCVCFFAELSVVVMTVSRAREHVSSEIALSRFCSCLSERPRKRSAVGRAIQVLFRRGVFSLYVAAPLPFLLRRCTVEIHPLQSATQKYVRLVVRKKWAGSTTPRPIHTHRIFLSRIRSIRVCMRTWNSTGTTGSCIDVCVCRLITAFIHTKPTSGTRPQACSQTHLHLHLHTHTTETAGGPKRQGPASLLQRGASRAREPRGPRGDPPPPLGQQDGPPLILEAVSVGSVDPRGRTPPLHGATAAAA